MTEAETTSTNGTAEAESTKPTDLQARIIRQIEYYFGNFNLPKDKFLQEQIKLDEGWVPMETMLKCKRLALLTTDGDAIFEALKKSSSELMELNEDEKKLRRSTEKPLPVYDDALKDDQLSRTIYCKGFPKDGSLTLDDLLVFFKPHGPFEAVKMRNYFDQKEQKTGFKGSVLVVFESKEKAEQFLAVNSVQFNKAELIRKWESVHAEEKRLEIEERIARKEKRKQQAEEKEKKEEETTTTTEAEELPEGCFLYITGLKDTTSRETLKEAISEYTDQLGFVDMKRGQTECYLRFKQPGCNKEMLECLQGHLKVSEAEVNLRLVEGDEEKEQLEKAKQARSNARQRGPPQHHQGKKRRFGGGKRGGWNKRQRT